MTLYNLKSNDGEWRITKFTNDLDVESSYRTSLSECECPAGHRPTCRHRQMLPKMLAYAIEDSSAFYDFETDTVLEPISEAIADSLEPQLTGLQEEQILMGFHQPELTNSSAPSERGTQQAETLPNSDAATTVADEPHPTIGHIKRRI